jgi:hypothetical protein
MNKLIFIASPFGHPDGVVRNKRLNATRSLIAKIIKEGNAAFSPIANTLSIADEYGIKSNPVLWKSYCKLMLSKSDELLVYKQDGWDSAPGVLEEIEYAKEIGIPIVYLTHNN